MKNLKISTALFAFIFFAFGSTALAQTQNTAPQIKIITPSDGQTIYGDKVPVLLAIDNLQLTDFQTTTTSATGQGHVHLWLDETNPTAQTAVKLIDDNYTYSNVAFGDHTLRAELVNNDHSSLNPPQVTTVQFKSAVVGSPSPVAQSSFDKNTALVILAVVTLVIVAAWWYTKEDDDDMNEQETKNNKQSLSLNKPKTKKKPAKKARSKRKV